MESGDGHLVTQVLGIKYASVRKEYHVNLVIQKGRETQYRSFFFSLEYNVYDVTTYLSEQTSAIKIGKFITHVAR